jgi:hypothetical protein
MRRIVTLCLFFLLLSACASAPTATPAPIPTDVTAPIAVVTVAPTNQPATDVPATAEATQPKPGSGVLFSVLKVDGSKFDFTLADLKKLPTATITVSSKDFQGPKLKDILAAAGVTSFKKIYLTGTNGQIRLDPKYVDDSTLLTFTDTGDVRLATPYLNKQFWTQGLSQIQVQ